MPGLKQFNSFIELICIRIASTQETPLNWYLYFNFDTCLSHILNVFFCFCLFPTYFSAKYILPCDRTDPQINQCIKRSFNHLKPFLGKGLPEINVPPLEPLMVDQMNMDNDAGAVRIKARFSNISAKGASNYTIREVRSDVKVNSITNILFSFFCVVIYKNVNWFVAMYIISETSIWYAFDNSTSWSERKIWSGWQCTVVTRAIKWWFLGWVHWYHGCYQSLWQRNDTRRWQFHAHRKTWSRFHNEKCPI